MKRYFQIAVQEERYLEQTSPVVRINVGDNCEKSVIS